MESRLHYSDFYSVFMLTLELCLCQIAWTVDHSMVRDGEWSRVICSFPLTP